MRTVKDETRGCVAQLTTPIVGPQERFDQRQQNHTRIALGELGIFRLFEAQQEAISRG